MLLFRCQCYVSPRRAPRSSRLGWIGCTAAADTHGQRFSVLASIASRIFRPYAVRSQHMQAAICCCTPIWSWHSANGNISTARERRCRSFECIRCGPPLAVCTRRAHTAHRTSMWAGRSGPATVHGWRLTVRSTDEPRVVTGPDCMHLVANV